MNFASKKEKRLYLSSLYLFFFTAAFCSARNAIGELLAPAGFWVKGALIALAKAVGCCLEVFTGALQPHTETSSRLLALASLRSFGRRRLARLLIQIMEFFLDVTSESQSRAAVRLLTQRCSRHFPCPCIHFFLLDFLFFFGRNLRLLRVPV